MTDEAPAAGMAVPPSPPDPPSADTVAWFMVHSEANEEQAADLASAELAARTSGYVVRWSHPWVCMLADIAEPERSLAISDPMYLEGIPLTDPRARQAERELLHAAGLDDPESFGAVRGAVSNGYILTWEFDYTCQLIDPCGALAAEIDGHRFDPGTDPAASPWGRVIAARLAIDAGLLA